jgi:hypothetical protein
VQQILLLAPVSKAAILCNNQLSFYALPELSPVNVPKLNGILWASIDENDLALRGLVPEGEGSTIRDTRGVVMFVGSRKQIKMIRVGVEVRLITV